jgi:hypothetical protein
MKKTTKRVLSVLLTAVLLLGMLPAVSLASGELTVVLSMEGLTLGQGLYVEPKAYTLGRINELLAGAGYGEYSETTLTAAAATVAMLLDNVSDFEYGGDDPEKFYLRSVTGIDKGYTAIPDVITENGGPSDEVNDGNGDDILGEFDYSEMAGWMVTSNNGLLPTGAGEYILHDGDVVRWQFSVWGYGADLGYDMGYGTEPFFAAAAKDALYSAYAFSTDDEAKAAALPVMEKLDATQEETDAALALLTGSAPISASFTAANFASAGLYAAEDPQTDLLSAVEAVEGSYTVALDGGEYVLRGSGSDGADLGSITLTVSENERDFTVYAVSTECTNAGWTLGRDFSVLGRAFSGGGGAPVERSLVMGTGGTFLCLEGDSVTATFTPSAARKNEDYVPATGRNTVTGPTYARVSAACSKAAALSVTYPYADENGDGENDFVLEVGQLTNYFIYSYFTPERTEISDGGESETAVFTDLSKGIYFYRVSDLLNDDAVTYGSYCSAEVGDNSVSVSPEDMYIGSGELKKNTVIDDFSNNAHDTGDIYLAVSGSGFDGAAGQLGMSRGDSAVLYPFRNWLAIEGTANAKVIEPDFHVEAVNVEGSPVTVTERLADDSSKHSFSIEAVSEGTAILLVTYDAVINGVGMGGKVFSAIRPENTGVIVVTVDGQSGFDTHMTINDTLNTTQANKLALGKYDAELDVLYYVGNDGASYTFLPDAGTEVTMAVGSVEDGRLRFGEFSDAGVTVDGLTGEVTLSGLKQGKTIVRLVKDGRTEYQILRARRTDLVVKNASDEVYYDSARDYVDPEMRFAPGEKVSFVYTELQHPANKLSGIYNMSASIMLTGADGKSFTGKAAQYDFGSSAAAHKLSVVIPDSAEGTYKLSGVIKAVGFGSYFGQHRELTYENGKTANFSAVMQTGYFGLLPAAELPIAPHEHAWGEWTADETGYIRSCACGESEHSVRADVDYTAQAAGAFLTAPMNAVTVDSSLAERYGYADAVTAGESASALDVLVQAHIDIFGDDFTPAAAGGYLTLDPAGYMSRIFGTETFNAGFTVNELSPVYGEKNEYDYYNGYAVSEAGVETGDSLAFMIYQDDFAEDKYTFFADGNGISRSFTVEEDTELGLTVSGYSIGWYGTMCADLDGVIGLCGAVKGAQLALVDARSGAITDIAGAVTDESGAAALSFAEPGEYLITAHMPPEQTAGGEKPLVMTLAKVTVTDTYTVTVAAYDYNAVEAGLDGASETGVIFERDVVFAPGASAAEIVEKAFIQAGVGYELQYGSYVSSVNGLGAGEGMSGWLLNYNNDDFACWGLDYITPADGDSISFHYSVNPDGATDDVGNGWYGKAIFTSFTLGDTTLEMSKTTEYDADFSAVTTYYLGGELIDGAGTEDDPFILSFDLPFGTDTADLDCAYTTQLGEHYRSVEGAGRNWSEPVTVTLSTNGGSKTRYRISAAAEAANGLVQYGDKWIYAVSGIQDTSFTGFAENEYGRWYVRGGEVDFGFTGLVEYENEWLYVSCGRAEPGYTGLVENENGWWYVKDGKVDFTYTGLTENEYGVWYVSGGRFSFDLSGVLPCGDRWIYVSGGSFAASFTGLAENENGWWYIRNGEVDFGYTGLVCNEYGWWYVRGGGLDFGFTGLVENENGWWYVENGHIYFDHTGLVCNEYGWWYVRDSGLDFGFTGLVENENGWWYVVSGHIGFDYTGIVENEYGRWYVRDSGIDFGFTGTVTDGNGTRSVVNGQVV